MREELLVGAASSRDDVISRLEAAPTVGFKARCILKFIAFDFNMSPNIPFFQYSNIPVWQKWKACVPLPTVDAWSDLKIGSLQPHDASNRSLPSFFHFGGIRQGFLYFLKPRLNIRSGVTNQGDIDVRC